MELSTLLLKQFYLSCLSSFLRNLASLRLLRRWLISMRWANTKAIESSKKSKISSFTSTKSMEVSMPAANITNKMFDDKRCHLSSLLRSFVPNLSLKTSSLFPVIRLKGGKDFQRNCSILSSISCTVFMIILSTKNQIYINAW